MNHPAIQIFDPELTRIRRDRAAARSPQSAFFLHDHVATLLEQRLGDIRRDFTSALILGAAGRAVNSDKIQSRITADPSAKMLHRLGTANALQIEHEILPVGTGMCDLVLSHMILHHINDLPGMLVQIRRALRPDGVFIAAMPGGESLHELRQSLMLAEMDVRGGASPRVAPFADMAQMGALMQRAGFALPVVDSEMITVTYDSIFALMHDLRAMGESNFIAARDRRNPGRDFFARAGEYYRQHFADPDGRIRASFEIIFMIGWAPHDSQQKPLKPGSATCSLADVL